MKQIKNTQNFNSKVLYTLLLLFVGFTSINTGNAQPLCPTLTGGFSWGEFNSTGVPETLFPGNIPAGHLGTPASTAGYLKYEGSSETTISSSDITIYPLLPTLTGDKSGSVVLKFDFLTFPTTTSSLIIYNGTSAIGIPILTINSLNASTYLGTEITISGPVTARLSNPLPGVGDFKIFVKYLTGDQVITSCQSREVAVWTDFMPAEGYTFIDDYGDPYAGNSAPICVGYFDSDKVFVSSSLSLCIDHDRDVASVMWWYYPGEIIYSFDPYANHDIDRSGTYDDSDKIKKARLLWLLANAPLTSKAQQLEAQMAVWATVDNSVSTSFTPGSLAQLAKDNVPELPVPFEPIFSISATPIPTTKGDPVIFTLDFDIPVGYENRVRLELSSGITINSVSMGTFNPITSILTFPSNNVTIDISATSAIAQIGSIKAIYDEDDFWNIHNLSVYQSCNPDVQDFIDINTSEHIKPFRIASAEWLEAPLSIKLVNFHAKVIGNEVDLEWTTLNEQNNLGFEVEHSTDAKKWNAIGTVASKANNGNSIEKLTYSYLDNTPYLGQNYYRLKQIDFDRKIEYSKICLVDFNSDNTAITISPNPTKDVIKVGHLKGNERIIIYDKLGQKVYDKSVNTTEVVIDLNDFNNGGYYVKIISPNGNTATHKIIKLQ